MKKETAERALANQDTLIAHLKATGRPRWEWETRKQIEAFEAAGFSVIRRPDLIDRGKPTPRPL